MSSQDHTIAPSTTDFDIIVIGGGTHAASIAAEAARSGLKTLLLITSPIGSLSSSTPTSIISSELSAATGFRISELMGSIDALEQLRRQFPHLVCPVATFISHQNSTRPAPLEGLAVEMYKCLVNWKTTSEYSIENAQVPEYAVMDQVHKRRICQFTVNINRIEIALLQYAQQLGAVIMTDTALKHGIRKEREWELHVTSESLPDTERLRAKVLISCCGSQTDTILANTLGVKTRSETDSCTYAQLFIKLRQNWSAAMVMQKQGQKPICAHRIDDNYICIGPIIAESASEEAKQEAISKAIEVWNGNTSRILAPEDISHECWFSQPAILDPCNNQQENIPLFDLNNPGNQAPILTLFGANTVLHKSISQQGLDIVSPFLRKTTAVNDSFDIPGVDFSEQSLDTVLEQLIPRFSFLPPATIRRMLYTYGNNIVNILGNSRREEDLGKGFANGLYEREIIYLKENEWATTSDDILWRRTSLGLSFSEDDICQLTNYLVA